MPREINTEHFLALPFVKADHRLVKFLRGSPRQEKLDTKHFFFKVKGSRFLLDLRKWRIHAKEEDLLGLMEEVGIGLQINKPTASK